jgi:uncharacterized protein with PIN domain
VWVAAHDGRDPDHLRCADVLRGQRGDLAATAPVVAETPWFVEDRHGPAGKATFPRLITRRAIGVIDLTADINPTRRTVFVREGKGGRDQIVPLGERAACWVGRYLTDIRPRLLLRGDLTEAALFVTRDGNQSGTCQGR